MQLVNIYRAREENKIIQASLMMALPWLFEVILLGYFGGGVVWLVVIFGGLFVCFKFVLLGDHFKLNCCVKVSSYWQLGVFLRKPLLRILASNGYNI